MRLLLLNGGGVISMYVFQFLVNVVFPLCPQSSFTLRVTAHDTNETTDTLVFYMQVNR